jgi:hypothetical protein
MIFKPFRSYLARHLEADELTLPLACHELDRLATLLGSEGESIYLTLRDNRHEEEIEVGIVCGLTVIRERGVGGTTPRKFPRGTEIFFRVTVSVVERLVCLTDCCEEPCPCEPVVYAGGGCPPGTVGVPWQGALVFSGATPMAIGCQVPPWMNVVTDARSVILSGTPTSAGTYVVSAAASNCGGQHVASGGAQLTVSEAPSG